MTTALMALNCQLCSSSTRYVGGEVATSVGEGGAYSSSVMIRLDGGRGDGEPDTALISCGTQLC